MTSASETTAAIRTAFHDVPRPTHTLEDIARAFIDRHGDFGRLASNWQDVTIERFVDPQHGDVLRGSIALMDATSWHHYLPAWMSIGLQSDDWELLAAALVTLDRQASDEVGAATSFEQRIDLLSEKQKQAIGAFVVQAVQHPAIASDPKSADLIENLIRTWQ